MPKKSISLVISSVLVKTVFVLIIVCCAAAPWMVRFYDNEYVLAVGQDSVYLPLLITLYCAAVPAMILIIALDRLLANISRGDAFINRNVMLLRVISYCCFAESVIFIYFGFLRNFAFLVVIAAAFFGLILRVIKNVFEQAIALREENDFTI